MAIHTPVSPIGFASIQESGIRTNQRLIKFKMLGIIVSVNTAGYAVGTPIANLTFDCLGTYQPMLLASACVMAGVTICIQQLLRRCAAEKSA